MDAQTGFVQDRGTQIRRQDGTVNGQFERRHVLQSRSQSPQRHRIQRTLRNCLQNCDG